MDLSTQSFDATGTVVQNPTETLSVEGTITLDPK
jgi:hypothetical protein